VILRNTADLRAWAHFWGAHKRAIVRRQWAAIARMVLHAHLDLLPNGWPPGRPADYIPDIEIGECSVMDHCDDIAGWLIRRGARPQYLLDRLAR